MDSKYKAEGGGGGEAYRKGEIFRYFLLNLY